MTRERHQPTGHEVGTVICLGLNPALDVTYRIDALMHGEAQRVSEIAERAGGKATNVARVVHHLGGRAHLIAALGGPNGVACERDLADLAVQFTHVPTIRATRRTVTVVESDGTTTALNEAGAPLPAAEWRDVRAALEAVVASVGSGAVVVLSGSIPPGVPDDAFADLVRLAHRHGARTIVDCSGSALIAAIEAGAEVVKPNRHELEATMGGTGLEAVQRLRQINPATTVVASDGPAGLLCVSPEGVWRATPGRELRGNPTGAGDAMVAALATGLSRGHRIPDLLTSAIGASGAAVLDPVAGQVDPNLARTLAGHARCIPLS